MPQSLPLNPTPSFSFSQPGPSVGPSDVTGRLDLTPQDESSMAIIRGGRVGLVLLGRIVFTEHWWAVSAWWSSVGMRERKWMQATRGNGFALHSERVAHWAAELDISVSKGLTIWSLWAHGIFYGNTVCIVEIWITKNSTTFPCMERPLLSSADSHPKKNICLALWLQAPAKKHWVIASCLYRCSVGPSTCLEWRTAASLPQKTESPSWAQAFLEMSPLWCHTLSEK